MHSMINVAVVLKAGNGNLTRWNVILTQNTSACHFFSSMSKVDFSIQYFCCLMSDEWKKDHVAGQCWSHIYVTWVDKITVRMTDIRLEENICKWIIPLNVSSEMRPSLIRPIHVQWSVVTKCSQLPPCCGWNGNDRYIMSQHEFDSLDWLIFLRSRTIRI